MKLVITQPVKFEGKRLEVDTILTNVGKKAGQGLIDAGVAVEDDAEARANLAALEQAEAERVAKEAKEAQEAEAARVAKEAKDAADAAKQTQQPGAQK